MKKLAAIFAALVLTACTPHTEEAAGKFSVPDDLKDCSIRDMWNTSGNYITVVRCPNSTTTTRTSGKNPRTTVVIDGAEYEKVEK